MHAMYCIHARPGPARPLPRHAAAALSKSMSLIVRTGVPREPGERGGGTGWRAEGSSAHSHGPVGWAPSP